MFFTHCIVCISDNSDYTKKTLELGGCIDSGFSSVMIDGSHLPYEENIALTKKVVEYAHQFDVTGEARECGVYKETFYRAREYHG